MPKITLSLEEAEKRGAEPGTQSCRGLRFDKPLQRRMLYVATHVPNNLVNSSLGREGILKRGEEVMTVFCPAMRKWGHIVACDVPNRISWRHRDKNLGACRFEP